MKWSLKGSGHYLSTGTSRTDSYKDANGNVVAPSEGMLLLAVSVLSAESTPTVSYDNTGWTNVGSAVQTGAYVIIDQKTAGAAEAATVTRQASIGGGNGFMLFAFPAGSTVTAFDAALAQDTSLPFDPITVERDALAMAWVMANGALTTPAFSGSDPPVTTWGRAPWTSKEVTSGFPQTFDPDFTNTTWRNISGVSLVVSAAAPPPASGGFFTTRNGQRVNLRIKVPSPNAPKLSRVAVSTDASGDPDDFQSLVRLMHYSDSYRLEGIYSSQTVSNNIGRPDLISEVIERVDLANLRAQGHTNLLTEAEAKGLVREGSPNRGAPSASRNTEASNHIIARARAGSAADPLYLLSWGPITNIAQACYTAPDIADKIRVYSIGSFNTDPGDLASHAWFTTFAHDNNVWWIECGVLPRQSRQTFFGIWNDPIATGDLTPQNYLNNVIGPRGTTSGGRFAERLGQWFPEGTSPPSSLAIGGLKEGDSPSLLYILGPLYGVGTLDDPTAESWGGRFEVIDPAYPKHWGDLKSSDADAQETVRKWRADILNHWTARWNRYDETVNSGGGGTGGNTTAGPTGGTAVEKRQSTSVFIGNQASIRADLDAWEAEYLGFDVKVVHHTLSKSSPSIFDGNVNAMFGNSPGTLYGAPERAALIFIMGFDISPDFDGGKTKANRFAHWAKWRNGAFNAQIDNLCNKLKAAGQQDARIGLGHESDIPNKVDSYTDLTISEIETHWVPTWRYIVNRILAQMPQATIEWRNNGGVMQPYKYASGDDQYQYEVILSRIADLVDNVSCSAYYSTDTNATGNWSGVTRSVKDRLDFTYSMAVKYAKNMSIYEWGMSAKPSGTISLDHPQFITNMHAWMVAHLNGIAENGAVIKFDYDVYFQRHYGSNLEKYPKAKAEYIRLFHN